MKTCLFPKGEFVKCFLGGREIAVDLIEKAKRKIKRKKNENVREKISKYANKIFLFLFCATVKQLCQEKRSEYQRKKTK